MWRVKGSCKQDVILFEIRPPTSASDRFPGPLPLADTSLTSSLQAGVIEEMVSDTMDDVLDDEETEAETEEELNKVRRVFSLL